MPKKKRTKKPKKVKMGTLLAKWSKLIRARDGYICLMCNITAPELAKNGKKSYLNAHHIIEKMAAPELRYELNNGITLCPTCHVWGRRAAHNNPIFFSEFLKTKRPEQWKWVLERS